MGRFPSGQREQTVNLPSPTSMVRIHPCPPFSAGMAELADALDSGSSESNFMQVQVLFPAPIKRRSSEDGRLLIINRMMYWVCTQPVNVKKRICIDVSSEFN